MKKLLALFFTVLLSSSLSIFAARTGFPGLSDTVSIDLPEGFYLVSSSSDGKSYLLSSNIAPVNAIIRLYDAKRFNSPKDAVDASMKNLKLNSESESFEWVKKAAAISSFTGNIDSKNSQGICMATLIPENSSIILIMGWSEQTLFNDCFNYIASLFDGLYVDMTSYFSKGILTAYLDSEAMEDVNENSSAEKTDVSFQIDGHQIKTELFKDDAKYAQELIEREYAVLCLYQTSDLWKEAWQRYYRLIFRDSCSRLRKASFDIYNTLAPYCKDETDLAQKLLTWVQQFDYDREKTNSDFANLPSILQGEGSDCDSRSMLLCVLLTAMNMDSCMFVSAEHAHAIAGMVSTHPGFSFEAGGKNYLTGETTARNINWGNIEQTMSDQSKWIPVLLP